MMTVPLDLLIPFLVGSILVTMIPGADMALVTRQVLVGGPALAQRTVYLGVQALLASRRPPTHASPAAVGMPRRTFLRGLISTVLNPKTALFSLTFLPQFVDRDAAVLPQTLTLAGRLAYRGDRGRRIAPRGVCQAPWFPLRTDP